MKTTTIILLFTVLSVFTLKAQQTSEFPEARDGATFIKLNDTLYFLFGGQATSKGGQTGNKSVKGLFFNSMSIFDSSRDSWKRLKTKTPPPGRAHHAAVRWNGKLYIIGGETANGLTNKIWEYNPATKYWRDATPDGKNFTPRKNLTAVVIGNKLYIAGGEDASGKALNDAYVVDMNTLRSTQIADLPGSSPASIGAAGAVLNGDFYLFGGYNNYGSTNSNIHYNATTQAWDMTFNTDFHTGFAGIANVSDIMAFIWGGSSTSKSTNGSKLYSYNAVTNVQTLISDNIPAGEYFYSGIVDIDSTSGSTPDTALYLWGGDVDHSFYKYSFKQDTVIQYDTTQGDFVTSIKHEKIIGNHDLTIYPNPANTFVKIKSTNLDVKNIQVIDISGKAVKTVVAGKAEQSVDISDLQKGIYFIKLNTAKGNITKKVIKE